MPFDPYVVPTGELAAEQVEPTTPAEELAGATPGVMRRLGSREEKRAEAQQ